MYNYYRYGSGFCCLIQIKGLVSIIRWLLVGMYLVEGIICMFQHPVGRCAVFVSVGVNPVLHRYYDNTRASDSMLSAG